MSTAAVAMPYGPSQSVLDGIAEVRPNSMRAFAKYAPLVLVLGTTVMVGPRQFSHSITEGTSVYSKFVDGQTADLSTDFNVVTEIDEIRQSLRLTVTDIAKALGKSRQAVYKWLAGGAQPEASTAEMIRFLNLVGQQFAAAGIRRPDSVVKMGLVGDRSILDLLRSEELTDEHVQWAIEEATSSESARSGLADRAPSGSNGEEWVATLANPGGRE